MENFNINIIYNSKKIAYNNEKYLYTNTLNYNRALVEYVNEEGNIEKEGKLYFIIKNNTDVNVYKPLFYDGQNDVLYKDNLPICYKQIKNVDDLKLISDDIILFSYPELHKDSSDIKKDINNIYYQDIVLKININGANNKLKVGEFEKYEILNSENNYHNLIKNDNSLYVDCTNKIDDNNYELHIINYGNISLENNIYYLLSIYHYNNINVYCKIKFKYNNDNIKPYNIFVNRKINIIDNKKDIKYNLLINKNKIFSNGSDTIDILKINSINGKHSIFIENKNDWIHCEIVNNIINSNNSFYDIKVSIDKNTQYQDRVGYIKIKHSDSNDVFKIIEIHQKTNINSYDKFINISDEFIFECDGGKKDYIVELFPFVDCKFKVSKCPNWIDFKINDNILTLICKKNKFGKREAYIELYNIDFPLNPIMKLIKQNGRF